MRARAREASDGKTRYCGPRREFVSEAKFPAPCKN
jgi:hypothetical protein